MKKLYETSNLAFALVCIVVYCVLQSLATPLNKLIGIEYSASALFCLLQALTLFFFVSKNGLMEYFGLCKSPVPARRFLYYIPLIVLSTRNLWNGVAVNYSPAEAFCRVLCMLCVGFVEELVFRGFLFRAIAKDSVKAAIDISSVTFGLGHILNLVNGSGMELSDNLFQIGGAIAFGFLFAILFYRGGSLIPPILAHAFINASSTFANGTGMAEKTRLVSSLAMFLFAIAYALTLIKILPQPDGAAGKEP